MDGWSSGDSGGWCECGGAFAECYGARGGGWCDDCSGYCAFGGFAGVGEACRGDLGEGDGAGNGGDDGADQSPGGWASGGAGEKCGGEDVGRGDAGEEGGFAVCVERDDVSQ